MTMYIYLHFFSSLLFGKPSDNQTHLSELMGQTWSWLYPLPFQTAEPDPECEHQGQCDPAGHHPGGHPLHQQPDLRAGGGGGVRDDDLWSELLLYIVNMNLIINARARNTDLLYPEQIWIMSSSTTTPVSVSDPLLHKFLNMHFPIHFTGLSMWKLMHYVKS